MPCVFVPVSLTFSCSGILSRASFFCSKCFPPVSPPLVSPLDRWTKNPKHVTHLGGSAQTLGERECEASGSATQPVRNVPAAHFHVKLQPLPPPPPPPPSNHVWFQLCSRMNASRRCREAAKVSPARTRGALICYLEDSCSRFLFVFKRSQYKTVHDFRVGTY